MAHSLRPSPPGSHNCLQRATIQQIRPLYKAKFKVNINQNEKQVLNELLENKTIIIKPANKGSAVVIMDQPDYLKECYRHMFDTKYYTYTFYKQNPQQNSEK